MDKSNYLNEVLDTHKMSHISSLLNKYRDKRQLIKEAIEEKHRNQIYSPLNSGSYAKHTAINTKFDLDVVIPFKKDSFSTLEEMFEDIFDFLYHKYSDEATVRKQKVSIGIEFFADDDGDVISIDIVPGRELNKDQYDEDYKLNLYVNSKYGLISEKSYIQTNIKAQIDHIKNRENERKIIRLLKIWKSSNNEDYKSFLFELITIKAFDKANISGNLWEKLEAVMKYIRDNITNYDFSLKDPGNSGNDVADTLESWQKENLSNKMNNMLDRINDNEDNLKIYFPTNEVFEEDDDESKAGYGVKEGASTFSIPTQNQRFG
ncbi:nucleotidyltransferase [Zunongwangia endophytica]|uniref:Nucleotidyltransferase n=1 Tax=Zunongwangia endophytica TaxID=1808945 RepID=A0ABV8HAS8_9FLAO|nr:nucleotidyltransferase [Zunongwangia endophytica]MDN3596806.1 nucleotidyltransferase [Zunongwangia endophytica]